MKKINLEDVVEQMIDECYPPMILMYKYEVNQGKYLKENDPILFRTIALDYADSMKKKVHGLR